MHGGYTDRSQALVVLVGDEQTSAINSLKEHVGTLENEVGVIINRAPSGPGGDATSAVDPDPLQGFLGKRVAEETIEASYAKDKSYTAILRKMPSITGVYIRVLHVRSCSTCEQVHAKNCML